MRLLNPNDVAAFGARFPVPAFTSFNIAKPICSVVVIAPGNILRGSGSSGPNTTSRKPIPSTAFSASPFSRAYIVRLLPVECAPAPETNEVAAVYSDCI